MSKGAYFIIGAAVGAVAVYYAIKHKEEILAKIEEVEAILKEKRDLWGTKAKEKFDELVAKFNQTVERYTGYVQEGDTTESQRYEIIEDLERIKQEIQGI